MLKKLFITSLVLISFTTVTSAQTQPKVSVQLWSVKNELKADFNATITALAAMGFDAVELAGEFGQYHDTPSAMAEFITSKGMTISGAHIGWDALKSDEFEKTVAFYQAAKVDSLTISWDTRAFDPNTVQQTIDDLIHFNKKLTILGFKFGYHNHAQEFDVYENHTMWDQIANSTPNSVVMQLDAGWAYVAGESPASVVLRHPGRTDSIHYKASLRDSEKHVESKKRTIIGEDSINWEALIKANKEVGGTRWLIVEQEEYPEGLSPLEAVALSKKGLDKLL